MAPDISSSSLAISEAGSRFRTKKISIKASLQILPENAVPELDETTLQRSILQVETGVDKEEEEEHHLREAINANLATVTGHDSPTKRKYIPTPQAHEDDSDYDRYYKKGYKPPITNIRFSSTVEECCGRSYCMDEEDEKWLQKFNKSNSFQIDSNKFELLITTLEQIIAEKQQYLTLNPSEILNLEEIEPLFIGTDAEKQRHLVKYVYQYWKDKKLRKSGKQLMPTLRFEENEKDDSDPYICFRRREVRQIRKTRRTDSRGSERLRRLRIEMKQARSLLEMVAKREKMQLESFTVDRDIFEQRVLVKELKRKLGMKDSDEELYATPKKKRQLNLSTAETKQPAATISTPTSAISSAARSHAKETEKLLTLAEFQENLEKRRAQSVAEAIRLRDEIEGSWVDATYFEGSLFSPEPPLTYFRFLVFPKDEEIDNVNVKLPDSAAHNQTYQRGSMTFRRRVGRGGRIMIDRISVSRNEDSTADTIKARSQSRDAIYENDLFLADEYSASAIRTRAMIWASGTERPTHFDSGNSANNKSVLRTQQQIRSQKPNAVATH